MTAKSPLGVSLHFISVTNLATKMNFTLKTKIHPSKFNLKLSHTDTLTEEFATWRNATSVVLFVTTGIGWIIIILCGPSWSRRSLR